MATRFPATSRSTSRPRQRPPQRRGVALADAIIGGVMLGIALTAVMSVTGRALSRQTGGEKRMVAAWLADEILNMVIVEGPDEYRKTHDTSGRFDAPFADYTFDVDLDYLAPGAPYRVTAVIRWGDADRDVVQVDTLIAVRAGEPEQLREPEEPVDREGRNFDDET